MALTDTASMGPGSFDPGSANDPRALFAGQTGLQWGRGLSTPEVQSATAAFARADVASMGPGSFDPGSERLDYRAARRNIASMGPGSFDPGSALERASSENVRRASMGPGSFDPGSPAEAADQISAPPASMGPGSFDPGSGDIRLNIDDPNGLQWGRGLSTPEVCCGRRGRLGDAELQWGRGLSTPEVAKTKDNSGLRTGASMGPGSFDPGSTLLE